MPRQHLSYSMLIRRRQYIVTTCLLNCQGIIMTRNVRIYCALSHTKIECNESADRIADLRASAQCYAGLAAKLTKSRVKSIKSSL